MNTPAKFTFLNQQGKEPVDYTDTSRDAAFLDLYQLSIDPELDTNHKA